MGAMNSASVFLLLSLGLVGSTKLIPEKSGPSTSFLHFYQGQSNSLINTNLDHSQQHSATLNFLSNTIAKPTQKPVDGGKNNNFQTYGSQIKTNKPIQKRPTDDKTSQKDAYGSLTKWTTPILKQTFSSDPTYDYIEIGGEPTRLYDYVLSTEPTSAPKKILSSKSSGLQSKRRTKPTMSVVKKTLSNKSIYAGLQSKRSQIGDKTSHLSAYGLLTKPTNSALKGIPSVEPTTGNGLITHNKRLQIGDEAYSLDVSRGSKPVENLDYGVEATQIISYGVAQEDSDGDSSAQDIVDNKKEGSQTNLNYGYESSKENSYEVYHNDKARSLYTNIYTPIVGYQESNYGSYNHDSLDDVSEEKKKDKKEVHYHKHEHMHEHDHKQEHVHKHQQEHVHDHDHGHKHEQLHKHKHDNKHHHGHKSEHKHEHKGMHKHNHLSNHKHEHKQEHKHGHNHAHKHEHLQDHEHKHSHHNGHKHKHHHENKHHHGHDHKQDHHHGHHHDWKHEHGHHHDHHHKSGHKHQHKSIKYHH